MMSGFFRVCFYVLSKVPPRVAYRLSRGIAGLLLLARSDAARTTQINLATCFPDKDANALRTLARESLGQMVLLVFEFSYLLNWPTQRILAQIEDITGRDALDDAWRDDRGILLLMPHFGNFELIGAFLGEHYSMAALYDPPRIKSLDPVISGARERHGGEMFAISAAGLRGLMKVIKGGGLGLILPDQVPERNAAGVASTFFGQPVQMMSLTHRIASKVAPHLLLATVRRRVSREGLTYTLAFRPLDCPPDSSEELHADTVNRAIEAVVLEAPEQYQWEYKRFKRPPGAQGQDNIYRRQ
jgi:KDO2-lipid IV(A) lauroyltransferase